MNVAATHNRIAVLAFFVMGALAAVVFRLAHLQLIQRSSLLEKAMDQQLRIVDVPARRGTISDRNGEVMAESLKTEDIFVSRRMLDRSERRALLRHAPGILGISKEQLNRELRDGRSFYLKRRAPLDQARAMRRLKLASLSFFPHFKRIYPQGRLASHVLGFADIDGKGLEGVESYYQEELSGRPGKKEIALDAKGRQLVSERVWLERPRDGQDLTLTLDSRFQHLAERELERAWKKYRAKAAAMVVMDPDNGEILALANFPNYDPNRPGSFSAEARRNRAVTDAFEPGSTLKGVTAALSLEAGVVTPDELIDCRNGKGEFLGRTVSDHDDNLGEIPFSEVIAHSSNVGTVEVAVRLGDKRLFRGLKKFGFGSPTGIDLPGETSGTFRELEDWSQVSLAAVSFGQEISCNVMRVASVYATLANGGKDVVPHVVREVDWTGRSGVEPRPGRKPAGRLVSSSAVEDLRPMLKAVVDHGSGTPAAFPGFEVAGKTGTSQKFDARRGRYLKDFNVATFAGFVPADNPKLVAVVMLDEPRGLTLGGWTAGPVFREAVSGMVALMNLPPDRRDGQVVAQKAVRQIPGEEESRRRPLKARQAAELAWVTVPDMVGEKRGDAMGMLKDKDLRALRRGKGSLVLGQYPRPGALVRVHSGIQVLLGDEPKTVASAGGVKR